MVADNLEYLLLALEEHSPIAEEVWVILKQQNRALGPGKDGV